MSDDAYYTHDTLKPGTVLAPRADNPDQALYVIVGPDPFPNNSDEKSICFVYATVTPDASARQGSYQAGGAFLRGAYVEFKPAPAAPKKGEKWVRRENRQIVMIRGVVDDYVVFKRTDTGDTGARPLPVFLSHYRPYGDLS